MTLAAIATPAAPAVTPNAAQAPTATAGAPAFALAVETNLGGAQFVATPPIATATQMSPCTLMSAAGAETCAMPASATPRPLAITESAVNPADASAAAEALAQSPVAAATGITTPPRLAAGPAKATQPAKLATPTGNLAVDEAAPADVAQPARATRCRKSVAAVPAVREDLPRAPAKKAKAIEEKGKIAEPGPSVASPPVATAPAPAVAQAKPTSDDTPGDRTATINTTSAATASPATDGPAAAVAGALPEATVSFGARLDAALQTPSTPGGATPLPGAALAAAPAVAVVPPLTLATPIVAAKAGRIGREMGVEIARRVAAGGEELTIRLDPAELGRVQVRLSFDESGSLRAVVAADSPAALDLLRRDSADLGRALADAGVRSDARSFQFDTKSGDGGQSSSRQPRGTPGDKPGGYQSAADTEQSYRPLRQSGLVDLMA